MGELGFFGMAASWCGSPVPEVLSTGLVQVKVRFLFRGAQELRSTGSSGIGGSLGGGRREGHSKEIQHKRTFR